MNLDDLLLGFLGAAITVYLFKQQPIPEFRPLYDITHYIKDALDLRGRIKKRRDRLDAAGRLESDAQLKDYTTRLERVEAAIRTNEMLSRALGIVLYVGLGGLVAGLLADDIEIEGVSNGFEAIVVGATWTSFIAGLGLRSELGKVSEIQQSVEQTEQTVTQKGEEVARTVERAATAQPGTPEASAAAAEINSALEQIKGEIREDLAVAQS